MSKMDRREFLGKCGRACLAAGAMPLLGNVALDLPGPVMGKVGNVSNVPARYFKQLEGKTVKCQLCPRHCEIKEGERGLCGVRENVGGVYVTKVYGRPVGDAVKGDPMEKGPFFHFLPATKTLALGTAGCNLTCLYCQSWQFAQKRPEQTDNETLMPEDLVAQVKKYGLKTITFTYSEPMIAVEYLADTAKEARKAGIRTLMHTSAGCNPGPLSDICKLVDAVNIDLKAYSRSFYEDVVGCKIDAVLENIKLVAESDVWLELTNLVIPGYNDDRKLFGDMCKFITYAAGANVPLHVSRFFPQYRLRNVAATPVDTMRDLRKLAYDNGLQYVYLGNMAGDPAESTYCPKCGVQVIRRVGFEVQNTGLNVNTGKCTKCGLRIPGIWK
ncbi:MAG: AmmeMemoRadiSam system radical SAM enzyme [Armatimonadia bacterium]